MKIETKPTIWHIKVSYGCYSDYSEDHYFVAANGRDEAKMIFKDFLNTQENYRYAFIFDDGDRFEAKRPEYRKNSETDWSTDYGDARDVELSMLEVIYP